MAILTGSDSLVERASTERVGADEGGCEAFAAVVGGILCAGGRLAGALEADEHDDVGFITFAFGWGEGRFPWVEHVAELGEDGFVHGAAAVDAGGQRGGVGGGLDVVDGGTDGLEADVGAEERVRDVVEAGG
nr:unnamed protein product [Digitaria exilis]